MQLDNSKAFTILFILSFNHKPRMKHNWEMQSHELMSKLANKSLINFFVQKQIEKGFHGVKHFGSLPPLAQISIPQNSSSNVASKIPSR